MGLCCFVSCFKIDPDTECEIVQLLCSFSEQNCLRGRNWSMASANIASGLPLAVPRLFRQGIITRLATGRAIENC